MKNVKERNWIITLTSILRTTGYKWTIYKNNVRKVLNWLNWILLPPSSNCLLLIVFQLYNLTKSKKVTEIAPACHSCTLYWQSNRQSAHHQVLWCAMAFI
jgi:hypothetical protein